MIELNFENNEIGTSGAKALVRLYDNVLIDEESDEEGDDYSEGNADGIAIELIQREIARDEPWIEGGDVSVLDLPRRGVRDGPVDAYASVPNGRRRHDDGTSPY